MTAISTDEFDRRFDDGEDLEDCLDMSNPIVHKAKAPRIIITPPDWVINVLDSEAEHRGISRKAMINCVLAEWADDKTGRCSQQA